MIASTTAIVNGAERVYDYASGRSLVHDDTRLQYGGSLNGTGERMAREHAASWGDAQYDHAETSFWGVHHIRAMRGYWLGVARAIRDQG